MIERQILALPGDKNSAETNHLHIPQTLNSLILLCGFIIHSSNNIFVENPFVFHNAIK